MALTVQQIHAAAAAIDASGQKPTLAGIRAKLGSGSYSTISAALATWEREPVESLEVDDMPDEVNDAVEIHGKTLWALAVKLARDEFEKERQAFQAELGDAHAKCKEVGDLADTLDFELQNARDQIEAHKDKIAIMAKVENQLRGDIVRLNATAEERKAIIDQFRLAAPVAQVAQVNGAKKKKITPVDQIEL